jgi:hypothetical protein
MKNVIAGVWGTCWLVMSCAETHDAHPAQEVPLRGTVLTKGPSVKAVRTGPAVIHAYSAFSGGGLYVVPAVTGTDADCAAGTAKAVARGEERIEADRRVTLKVAASEVACLATNTKGNFELLWHAHEEPVVDVTTIAVGPRVPRTNNNAQAARPSP